MWPKLLMQLVEFLPHATRLLPVADRFLATSGAPAHEVNGEILKANGRALEANAAALQGISDGVQASLGKVARAHIEMAAKLDEFAGHIGEIGTEAKRARRAAELAQTRVDALEKQMGGQRTMLVALLAISAVLLVVVGLLTMLLLHGR